VASVQRGVFAGQCFGLEGFTLECVSQFVTLETPPIALGFFALMASINFDMPEFNR
jgi:hypothetical protein